MSGKELFLKRGREFGSDVSKSSCKIGVSTSPTPKRVKVIVPPSPPHVMKYDHPLEAPTEWRWPPLHRYNVNAEPKELMVYLNPLLLPETTARHGPKTVDQVMVEAIGHSFHVSYFSTLSIVLTCICVVPEFFNYCLQAFQVLIFKKCWHIS